MSNSAQTPHLPPDADSAANAMQIDASPDGTAMGEGADALIKEILQEEKGGGVRNPSPKMCATKKAGKPKKTDQRRGFFKRGWAGQDTPESAAQPGGGNAGRVGASRWASLRGYRPTRKHVLITVAAIIFLWRPWLIPVTLLLIVLVLLVAYFSLGPDRVSELIVSGWQRLNRMRPAQAEIIRARAERSALRFEAFLSRMPGKWADQIHVPDFSKDQDIATDGPDPFDRLAKEVRRW